MFLFWSVKISPPRKGLFLPEVWLFNGLTILIWLNITTLQLITRGEWCKRQASGSYDGIIGWIQITKASTLTFLLQTFFACDVRCVFMALSRSVCSEQISRRYLGISGEANRSDAVDVVRTERWCWHSSNPYWNFFFWSKLFLPVGAATFICATYLLKEALTREKDRCPV